MITTKNSFLKDDALSLKLNCLKEVTKLELNAGKLRNASSNFFIHGASDLKQSVDALAIELKRSFESTVLIRLFCTCKELSYIIVLKIEMLHNWENFDEIAVGERKCFISDVLERLLGRRLLTLLLLLA